MKKWKESNEAEKVYVYAEGGDAKDGKKKEDRRNRLELV